MGRCYHRLTFIERLIIEKLYKKNMQMNEIMKIADLLHRDRTTVVREIKRNMQEGQEMYDARLAQKRADERRKIPRKSEMKQVNPSKFVSDFTATTK